MQIKITKTDRSKPEFVEIHCHTVSNDVQEIAAFVKSRQGLLTGISDERQYEIAVSDIFYLESVKLKSSISPKV